MVDNRKKRVILVLILVAAISVSLLGTYAFFITQTGRNEEQKLTIKTGSLSLIFEDNDEGLTKQMELDKSYSKELTIKNTGTEAVMTNMIWKDLVNTYIEESLSYTLEYKTTEDGEWQTVETAHTNMPESIQTDDYNLATNLTIPANTTYYYKITITFNNLPDINQETDKTAVLSTKFRLGEKVKEQSSEKTLSHLKLDAKGGNPLFANPATTDETRDGLYSLEDDYGTSYYYRGAVENNYVKFGGFYWRIIRINGDGSIRMMYDGTQAYANANGGNGAGEADRFTHLGQAWNTNYNDVKYVGWMYGPSGTAASTSKEEAQENIVDSEIKTQVDAWYKANIVDKGLSKYVSDEIFCNDRSMGESDSTFTNLGYGRSPTNFAARTRFYSSAPGYVDATPIFICEQKNDAFTVGDTTNGNGDLTYPVGLITADEIVTAGSGKFGTTNRYYYLYKSSKYWYWSMSPYDMATEKAGMFIIDIPNGDFIDYYVYGNGGSVAAVINISPKYAITLTGTGTMSSPYQIPGVA